MAVYTWSQTAASNASADNTINWAEGQAPSTVNDSARAMMAAVAKYRDDIAGAIVTGGTSTAYTVTSNSGFDTLAHLNGQLVAFSPHTNNGATVTLNVDGLGAKPLRLAPNVELQSGALVQGTPYFAVYNNSDGAFYLYGASSASTTIPLGAGIDYWGATAPNSSFALAYGQAISRTTYATLFSLFGTTYGAGDGSTTFNIPDLRGRVVAGVDNMGGTAANRLTSGGSGITGTTLGANGGAETETLTASQIPTINTSGTITVYPSGNAGNVVPYASGGNSWSEISVTGGGGFLITNISSGAVGNASSFSASNTMTSTNTGGQAHVNVQPTIVANKILRII